MLSKNLIEDLGLKEKYGRIFRGEFEKDPLYEEILEVGKRNSEEGLWILGGYVYRTIIDHIYHSDTKKEQVDIDFLTQRMSEERYVPEGWKSGKTDFGDPCMMKGKYKIDINDMNTFHSITSNECEATIENILRNSPLTIQSIAWDLEKKKLLGNRGILAILYKTVGVNNLSEAEYESKRKGLFLEDLVSFKAQQLGFKPQGVKRAQILGLIKELFL
ncbi:hypothetical protein K0A97_01230 [Patescibacteria group bacterium]|nr:hypothetical protein [Patescibacteria group bacterium]